MQNLASAGKFSSSSLDCKATTLIHYLPSAPPTCWRVTGDRSTCLLSPYETWAVAEETDLCHAEVSKERSAKLVAYQIKCVREAANAKKGWIDHLQGSQSDIVDRSTVTHGSQ